MSHPVRPALFVLILGLLSGAPAFATPDRWLKEIDQLTAKDATNPPEAGGTVFVGSSSIRMWSTLAQDFPQAGVIKRGFGGSELSDSVHYADRIVIPYQPRAIVLYAGENDLVNGKTAEALAADFTAFRKKIRAALPNARLLYLAIKESPSRARIREQVLRANQLIAADCATDPLCTFVDVATPMLDAQGRTRPEIFLQDQLHLNPDGYAIWTKVLAPHLAAAAK